MNKKTTFKRKLKSGLCKTFWYLFIIQSLYIIYSIAPKPQDPIITIADNFITLSGPNIVEEGSVSDLYTINVHQDLKQDLNITLAYSSTATEGVDFIPVKHLYLKKGEFTKSFQIQTINDMMKEQNDVYAVKIQTISGKSFLKDYNASEMSGVVFTKIIDELHPKQAMQLDVKFDKHVYENQGITYTITSKKALLEDLTLAYEIRSTDSQTYKKSGKVVLKKGEKSTQFTIHIEDDNIIENSQYLEIHFKPIYSKLYEAIKLKKEVLKTVIEDEKKQDAKIAAKISITTPELKSNIIAEDKKYVEISLASTQEIRENLKIKIDYAGEAIEGQDFKGPKSIIFEKNTRVLKFTLEIINDDIKEKKKSLQVSFELLSKGGLENIEVENKLKFILVDEKNTTTKAKLYFTGPTHVSEPQRTQEYTLSTTQVLAKDLVVALSYEGSTAKEDIDFIPVKWVSILKGHKSNSFVIDIIDDNKVEKLEKIVVSVASIKGGGLEKIVIDKNRVVETSLSDEEDITTAFRTLITNKKIVFEMSSDEISEDSPHALDEIARLLKEFSNATLVIEGHTNHLGTSKHNFDLSQRRAQKVKSYLVEKGIDEKRLTAIGYGDSQPMVPIDSPNAIELNKRVDFRVEY